MAVNKPVGDNARKGALKKRSQLGDATAWTKRNKLSGELMAVKKPRAKKPQQNSRASGGKKREPDRGNSPCGNETPAERFAL